MLSLLVSLAWLLARPLSAMAADASGRDDTISLVTEQLILLATIVGASAASGSP